MQKVQIYNSPGWVVTHQRHGQIRWRKLRVKLIVFSKYFQPTKKAKQNFSRGIFFTGFSPEFIVSIKGLNSDKGFNSEQEAEDVSSKQNNVQKIRAKENSPVVNNDATISVANPFLTTKILFDYFSFEKIAANLVNELENCLTFLKRRWRLKYLWAENVVREIVSSILSKRKKEWERESDVASA